MKDKLMQLHDWIEKFRHGTVFSDDFASIEDHPVSEQYFLLAIAALESAQRYAALAAHAVKTDHAEDPS